MAWFVVTACESVDFESDQCCAQDKVVCYSKHWYGWTDGLVNRVIAAFFCPQSVLLR